jgi:hypothetical protein
MSFNELPLFHETVHPFRNFRNVPKLFHEKP